MNPNRQNTSMSPLANLRNVRISLQKQEQVLVQKFHAETLNQITKLMFDAELTLDDINSHLNSNKYSSNKVKRQNKANVNAGLKIEDIGLFEINEAFAVQVLSFLDHFGMKDADPRVNIHGGAIAVGHPLASSGIRLMLNLARGFEKHHEVQYGITTMCIGLGMGGTVIWENPHFESKAGAR